MRPRSMSTTAMATGSSPRSTPFPGFEGTPSVAMGDVDDDGVLDLVVGAGKDYAPEVVAYSGKAKDGKAAFATEIARFEAFDSDRARRRQRDVDADRRNDRRQHHRRLRTRHPERGQGVRLEAAVRRRARRPRCSRPSTPTPTISSASASPRASSTSRPAATASSRLQAPAAPTQVKVFNFSLMPLLDKSKERRGARELSEPGDHKAAVTAAFMPFGIGYRGGALAGDRLADRGLWAAPRRSSSAS